MDSLNPVCRRVCDEQLFIRPDAGSPLHVTAWPIKIAPSAHVLAVRISCTSKQPPQNSTFMCRHVLAQNRPRRDVNYIKSHKKRITYQIKPKPAVTSAVFSLNHAFSRFHGASVESLRLNQPQHPNCRRVCVMLQICRLLMCIFTLIPFWQTSTTRFNLCWKPAATQRTPILWWIISGQYYVNE